MVGGVVVARSRMPTEALLLSQGVGEQGQLGRHGNLIDVTTVGDLLATHHHPVEVIHQLGAVRVLGAVWVDNDMTLWQRNCGPHRECRHVRWVLLVVSVVGLRPLQPLGRLVTFEVLISFRAGFLLLHPGHNRDTRVVEHIL